MARRTMEEILAALQNGQLDMQDLKTAEVVTLDKIDKSGDEPRLMETVTITKVEGQDAEIHVVKH